MNVWRQPRQQRFCLPAGWPPPSLAFNPLARPKAGGVPVPWRLLLVPETHSFWQQKHSSGKVVLDLLKFHRMSGLQPPILPPPPIPMPSPSVLAEELYKCANPPPSYSVAIGAPDATPVQGRHQLQAREVIVGPFGGSLCRVVPMTSAQLEPPPAYSRRSPSNGDF